MALETSEVWRRMNREWKVPDVLAAAVLTILVTTVFHVLVGILWTVHLRAVARSAPHELSWLWRVVSFPIVVLYQLASGNRGQLPEWVLLTNALAWGVAVSVVVLRVSKEMGRPKQAETAGPRSTNRSSDK